MKHFYMCKHESRESMISHKEDLWAEWEVRVKMSIRVDFYFMPFWNSEMLGVVSMCSNILNFVTQNSTHVFFVCSSNYKVLNKYCVNCIDI